MAPHTSRARRYVPLSDVVFVVLRRRGDLVVTRHLSGPRAGQRVTHTAAFVAASERR